LVYDPYCSSSLDAEPPAIASSSRNEPTAPLVSEEFDPQELYSVPTSRAEDAGRVVMPHDAQLPPEYKIAWAQE